MTGQLDVDVRHLLWDNIKLGYDRLTVKSNTPANANWRAYTSLKDSSGKFTLFAFDDQERDSHNQDNSIWNSAFMAQLFIIGRAAAPISDRYLVKLLDYIKSKQSADGSFHDHVNIPYYCSHTSASKVPLTAFILVTFIKCEFRDLFHEEIDASMEYLINQARNMDEDFDLAITAYAMSLELKRSTKNTEHIQRIFYQLIDKLIRNSDEFGNKMLWRINGEAKSSSKYESVQFEIASYVLLAMVNSRNKIEYMDYILKINNWLYSVKNSKIGYMLSHDTGEASIFYIFINLKIPMSLNYLFYQQFCLLRHWVGSRNCSFL